MISLISIIFNFQLFSILKHFIMTKNNFIYISLNHLNCFIFSLFKLKYIMFYFNLYYYLNIFKFTMQN